MTFFSPSTKTHAIALGFLAAASAMGLSHTAVAKSQADTSPAREWTAKVPERPGLFHKNHPLHPHCADAYPMHHLARCGTATGGPSGGIH